MDFKEAYSRFRSFDTKRRVTVREHLFDYITEVLAYYGGVEEARPPSDEALEQVHAELNRRTFDSLQKSRDEITLAGLRRVRDDALPPDLKNALKGIGITTPGHLLSAIREKSLPDDAFKSVLDYLGLQRKGGRPRKAGQEGKEVEVAGNAGGNSG